MAYLCLNKPGFVFSCSACKIMSCSPSGLLFPGVDHLAKASLVSPTRQNRSADAKITRGLTEVFPGGTATSFCACSASQLKSLCSHLTDGVPCCSMQDSPLQHKVCDLVPTAPACSREGLSGLRALCFLFSGMALPGYGESLTHGFLCISEIFALTV